MRLFSVIRCPMILPQLAMIALAVIIMSYFAKRMREAMADNNSQVGNI